MIDRIEGWLRNVRRMASRSEWSVRRLGRPLSEQTAAHSGLVLIHLPALPLARVQEALARGRLPFFKRLLETEGYQFRPLADCDSCAPVETEARLFYGFTNHQFSAAHQPAAMDQNAAIQLEQGLSQQRPGLLQGGSQYGGLLSGGASECHFCAMQPGWGSIFAADNGWRRAGVLIGHAACFVRAGVHAAIESLIALGNWPRNRAVAKSIWAEMKQALARVRNDVLHHDLAVVGAGIDTARGLPIVHVNLSGYYDRQRALRGIERAVRSIWLSAGRSARRDYDVWIYASRGERGTSPTWNAAAAPAGRRVSGRETPFALLPADAPLAQSDGPGASLADLREAALHVLGLAPLPAAARPLVRPQRATTRVMTYNVHSCLGMDGKLSPARIARIIARYAPDVVALQELDVGRARTGGVDQAQKIARELEMEFHFHPALALEEELYGDAILSRYPMRLRRAAALPGLTGRPEIEPRGALWVTIEIEGREIQFLNTHLGLVGLERSRQVAALLATDWLAHSDCRGPTILCGDFNALPRSKVCRRLSERLADAQQSLDGHRPKHTFFGRYPIGRIDHVFVSREIEVVAVEVPRNDLTRRASDHLPLVVDLRLP